jgi:hypothetical protein
MQDCQLINIVIYLLYVQWTLLYGIVDNGINWITESV